MQRFGNAGIAGVDLLDPATGTITASIDGVDGRQVTLVAGPFGGGVLQARRNDAFEIYDLDSFAPLGRFRAPALGGRSAGVVRSANGWLAVTSWSLLLLDEAGGVRAETLVNPDPQTPLIPPLALARDGHGVLLLGQGNVSMFDTDDDQLQLRWQRRALVVGVNQRQVAMIDANDGNGQPGDGPVELVDALAGRATWTSPWSSTVAGTTLADDGRQWWRHRTDRGDSVLVPDGSSEFGPASGPPPQATITLLG